MPDLNFGYQTIVFGPVLTDVDEAIRCISQSGFTGIEIAQHPKMIFSNGKPVTYRELIGKLRRYKMKLLGLAGGSLQSRMDFCDESPDDPRPLYLYADQENGDEIKEANKRGYKVALHPHVFRSTGSLQEICDLIKGFKADEAAIILDTAHLHIAGVDPIAALKQHLGHAVAVHLKDWTSVFGFSPLRYAKGFVPLFRGEVEILQTLSFLRERAYDGWTVAEQDYSRESPYKAVMRSAEALGISPKGPLDFFDDPPPLVTNTRLLNSVLKAQSRSLNACYKLLSETILEITGALVVSISACSPSTEDIVLLHNQKRGDEMPDPETLIASKSGSMIDAAIQDGMVKQFTVGESKNGSLRKLVWENYAKQIGSTHGVAIPVPLRYNPNYPFLGLLLLFGDENQPPSDRDCIQIGLAVGIAVDASLDQEASESMAKIRKIAQQQDPLGGFLEAFVNEVKASVKCAGVSVFLKNLTEDELVLAGTTGIQWNAKRAKKSYSKKDSGNQSDRVAQCWAEKRPILLSQSDFVQRGIGGDEPISYELMDEQPTSGMLVPIRRIYVNDKDRDMMSVIGVVRCTEKQPPHTNELNTMERWSFTEEDLTIVDSACQAAAPFIEMRRAYDHRLKGISRITHELKTPVNALRQEVRSVELRIRTLARLSSLTMPAQIEKAFLDVYALTDLANRAVNNASLYGLGRQSKLRPERVGMVGDVIAPAIGQIRFLVESEGFDISSIAYDPVDSIPRLHVDRNQFQQVFFNLLSNAIKYAHPEIDLFEVYISLRRVSDGFLILFTDYGIGVEDHLSEIIFEDGIRGPTIQAQRIEGLGLGLFIVRQIVEAHGGRVRLLVPSPPTTFEIWLPKALESGFPKKLSREDE